jgi:hypothetical protein
MLLLLPKQLKLLLDNKLNNKPLLNEPLLNNELLNNEQHPQPKPRPLLRLEHKQPPKEKQQFRQQPHQVPRPIRSDK